MTTLPRGIRVTYHIITLLHPSNFLHSTYYSLTVLQFVDFLLAPPPRRVQRPPQRAVAAGPLEKSPSGPEEAWLRGGAVHGCPMNGWVSVSRDSRCRASARAGPGRSLSRARVLSPSGSRGEGRPSPPAWQQTRRKCTSGMRG